MSQRSPWLCLTLLLAALAAGCGDDGPARMNVAGPGPMNGSAGPMGGGAAGGMGGASMMVVSEFDYLTGMIPHHEEAIAAARILQSNTRRVEMRAFAASIIETQGAEVEQMKAWLAAWYPGRAASVSYRPMMRDLAGLAGDPLDRAFLEDMIPHHMMAVMMSQQLLARQLTLHAPIGPFAERIRDTQRAEIQMMSGWLADWFRG